MDLAVKGRGSHALTLLQGPRVCMVALQLPKPFAHQQEQEKSLGSSFSHPTASQKTTTHLDVGTPRSSSGIEQL